MLWNWTITNLDFQVYFIILDWNSRVRCRPSNRRQLFVTKVWTACFAACNKTSMPWYELSKHRAVVLIRRIYNNSPIQRMPEVPLYWTKIPKAHYVQEMKSTVIGVGAFANARTYLLLEQPGNFKWLFCKKINWCFI